MVVAVVSLIALAVAFYFIDPLNMFTAAGQGTDGDSSVNEDSSGVAAEDSLNSAASESDDTTEAVIPPVDVTEAADDTLAIDDPFNLRLISLPDSLTKGETPVAANYRHSVQRGVHADLPEESNEIVFTELGLLAPAIPVVLDDGAFLVYDDTTSVLVLAVLHPEETEVRIRLMREVAALLIPTDVDQLVLIYRENRFQDAVLYSLVKEAFPDVEGILNPRQFQGILGYRDDTWESISGPVTQWLSSME
jgi:hypothetical protein